MDKPIPNGKWCGLDVETTGSLRLSTLLDPGRLLYAWLTSPDEMSGLTHALLLLGLWSMFFFPKEGRFVRPGSSTYREWQTLAYENTPSLETRLRLKKLAEIQSEPELPCTQTPKYKWPSRILLRPKEGTDQVHMARLQPDPCVRHVRFAQDATTQTDEAVEEEIVKPVDAGVDISDPNDVPEGAVAQEDVRTEYSPGDEISLDVAVGSDNDPDLESGNPWASDDDSLDLLDEYWEIPIQGMPGTPVEKLAQEYERVMRVTAEDLELVPAVYMQRK